MGTIEMMERRASLFAVVILSAAVAGCLGTTAPAVAQETDTTTQTGDEGLSKKEKKQRAKEERIRRYEEAMAAQKAETEAVRSEMAGETAAPAPRSTAAEAPPAAPPTQPPAQPESRSATPPPSEPQATPTAAEADAAPAADTAEPRGWKKYKADRQAAKSAAAAATVTAVAAADTAAEPAATDDGPPTSPLVTMDKNAWNVHDRLKAGPVGSDIETAPYIHAIDRGRATAAQVGTFAGILASRGFDRDALVYYDVAVEADPTNDDLLYNFGSLLLVTGEYGTAEAVFSDILIRDPNNAAAHYNLGVVFQMTEQFDDAVNEFRTALLLDPSLGDPESNPSSINNELMMPVKLELYNRGSGGLVLPPVELPDGEIESH